LGAVATTGLGFFGGRPRGFLMGMATWDRVFVVVVVAVLGRVLKVAGGACVLLGRVLKVVGAVGFNLGRVLDVVGGVGVGLGFVLNVAGWATLSRRTSLLMRLNAGDAALCETDTGFMRSRGGTVLVISIIHACVDQNRRGMPWCNLYLW